MRPPSRGLAGSVLAVAFLLGAPALASAQTPVDCSDLQDPAQYSACLDQTNGHEHTGDHHSQHGDEHAQHQSEHARHHNEHHPHGHR
ncbi:hypothetical protein SAMN02982929_00997 [Saccharopolyspora kobensis]|uniref:Uncharacterized protein n=1 Tax=Saccharopolyspora kobensis TaxID=146035 RepID=A0A1H5VW00_9PSEU|nr:hypothetical protein [Saccharopolyspora kobensis]SEF91168.1 hypothetical protein SAMN02982929_00997 [Saccharopolyspora kobensis]SFC56530.1 hypothetical protein SAMN05216506_1011072 [Saccharopolyspora kobensis]